MAQSVVICRLSGKDQFTEVESWINSNVGIGWDFEFLGLEEKPGLGEPTRSMLLKLRFYKKLDALIFLKDFAIPHNMVVQKHLSA